MANNLTIYPQYNPRLIIVDAPDTEESMQNLVDDTRTWENLPANLSYAKIIDASGKEPLGLNTFVGITVKLNNAVLGFAPRNDSVSTGTITTADANGLILTDSGADFVTDGVIPGATVINFTDKSVATVLLVTATQLTCLPLSDGTDNQFDVLDEYKIWNIIQVEANGGNLTAVDDNGFDISPIFTTAFTQVVRTSSASATLQELTTIQYGSYNGGVMIDEANLTKNTTTSTKFPAGTAEAPVLTYAQLNIVAETVGGLNKIFVIGNSILTNDANWDRREFIGESKNNSILTLPAGVSTDNCKFIDFELQGELGLNNTIENCIINGVTNFGGDLYRCEFEAGSTTVLAAGVVADMEFCRSGEPGLTTPIIDCNGTGIISNRGYLGGHKYINYSGSAAHSIDSSSGQYILDSATITGGLWVFRGKGKLVDENGNPIYSGTWNGTVTIINELDNAPAYAKEFWETTICP